jgi:glycine cleavage system P protein (glycine dehydrogenase)
MKSPDAFVSRHVGPDATEIEQMLRALDLGSLDELVAQTVPAAIRLGRALALPPAASEAALLDELSAIAARNQVWKSYLGMGYSDTITPPVIARNILESPGWYTQYTPYQAEIAQGRLEALLNYQQMVMDLTGLPVANASLLDEATAAAEAMTMLFGIAGHDRQKAFLVADHCHPQTIAVVKTRAEPLGIEVVVGDPAGFDFRRPVFGVLVQNPASDGELLDHRDLVARAHAAGALVVVAADILSLALVAPPGDIGADVAVGSSQRFGVPLGYGGPHAAYFATRTDYVRKMPGRLIGVSKDAQGKTALRMALATREQHIRREKATSNICTAQVLLAVAASMYAVYHGPAGIRAIAEHVHGLARALAAGLGRLGVKVAHERFFDTLRVEGSPENVNAWLAAAAAARINLRRLDERSLGVSLDETTSASDVAALLTVFGARGDVSVEADADATGAAIPQSLRRSTPYLTHPVFNTHHSETEMLRYMKKLESRDLSLTHSMIALGSCTMKLNATAEMIPISWSAFARLHPFVPVEQAQGYRTIFEQLEAWLAEITGFAAISLQPNAGSQGEYAGLLVIRKHHLARGQGHRNVCLIPKSAHGTNPASATMAGMKVVVVATDAQGNIDVADLTRKAREHAADLAALMVTYPSTHGVFEEEIKTICQVVHEHGGQVYMDGANLNAQVGLCRPADVGADVCHLNLHKTFCIPHGGGGPGMGPIGVAAHLQRFLPRHPVIAGVGGADGIGAVSAAPWGSADILLISWAYIRMMGAAGLRLATCVAILNANYVARRLEPHFPVVYRGARGRVAHECIVDMRQWKNSAGVEVEDIAKRLIDYGFHAPTISFPIPGTMMIEPTESEPKAELDRFCDALIAIRGEIREIETGQQPREDNLLANAPHTAEALLATEWTHPYPRERAAYPLPWVRGHKFWPAVSRLNNVLGDRQFVCSCPPPEE